MKLINWYPPIPGGFAEWISDPRRTRHHQTADWSRNIAIYADRYGGDQYRIVAEKHGISPQRARQIVEVVEMQIHRYNALVSE
jgi:hypothetical protein